MAQLFPASASRRRGRAPRVRHLSPLGMPNPQLCRGAPAFHHAPRDPYGPAHALTDEAFDLKSANRSPDDFLALGVRLARRPPLGALLGAMRTAHPQLGSIPYPQ